MMKTLVIGIGNIGRADDGLGWAFVDRLEDDNRFDVVKRYQLQVEDANLIAGYEQIWFIDASHRRYENGFECEILEPEGEFSYTSHELPPSAILYLCSELYNCFPDAYLLGISGEDWELGHSLTPEASQRLNDAFAYFMNKYEQETRKAESRATRKNEELWE